MFCSPYPLIFACKNISKFALANYIENHGVIYIEIAKQLYRLAKQARTKDFDLLNFHLN